jgi:glycosyltransferase involved in cell wall biosynthesis
MTPEIAVVVASHDRPLRLRWLLEALAEQTLERDRFEVVVAHDSHGEETDRLLTEHPLAKDGTLRHVRRPPGSSPPGANRNAGWRATRAPLIAFTDDDCRPPHEWLYNALEAATTNRGAIVQGATRPDPDEHKLLYAPVHHKQHIDPPTAWAQTCNIVYPREVLERLGGFDEQRRVGEDAALAATARQTGVDYVADPDVLTYHAVVPTPLPRFLRSLERWEDLPLLVREHPEMRCNFPLRIFWKWTHAWLPLAAVGVGLTRRTYGLSLLLALPWAKASLPYYGPGRRNLGYRLRQGPRRAAIDVTEMAVLARGSLRHRSLLL